MDLRIEAILGGSAGRVCRGGQELIIFPMQRNIGYANHCPTDWALCFGAFGARRCPLTRMVIGDFHDSSKYPGQRFFC
jgi:hypothetical protein